MIGALKALVKSALQKYNFLISQPKHMLCVLNRNVSVRHPTYMQNIMVKKIIKNFTQELLCLSKAEAL